MSRLGGARVGAAVGLVGVGLVAQSFSAGAATPAAGATRSAVSATVGIPAHPTVGNIVMHPHLSARSLGPLITSTVPVWRGTKKINGVSYQYAIVGKNPKTAQTNPTTTITAEIIPIKLRIKTSLISGTVFDPTKANATCSPGASPLTLTKQSPIFTNTSWTFGGTSEGTTQYTDAFQRANFSTYTGPTGVNPNYHVLLSARTQPVMNVTMSGSVDTHAPCGTIGYIDLDTWDKYVQTTLFPALATQGVGPKTFPIFLLSNVAMSQGSQCCALGYHNAFSNPAFGGAIQTYAVAEYDTNGTYASGGTQDITALSHEVGEWMNDPFAQNITPPWGDVGNVGQVNGCQDDYEVGDPLSDNTNTIIPITMPNGHTYHPQELAFFSWFYRDTPSIAVNGWYSNHGYLTTAASTVRSDHRLHRPEHL